VTRRASDAPTATYGFEDQDELISRVRVVTGPDTGAERPVSEAAVRVGKSTAADLVLTDRGVSRMHCELAPEGTFVRVRDLDSKNGTWIAGCRIANALVPADTRIRVGETTLELVAQRERVRRMVWQGGDRFGPMLARSRAMYRVFALLARIAELDQPVLLRGESGTGKELAARAIHESGPRARGPFVVVDGAALSHTLADAELFGHERGAFTGADVARPGAFERANGGTVFLDELGELPVEIQAKLLRVLAEGEVRRVGGEEVRKVDVRVIAATHRPLEKMVNQGAFREDLLHRLSVFVVRIPSLRDRPEDVRLIARTLLAEQAPGDDRAAESLEAALAAKEGYRWPGNVRELRSFVRRVVALGDATLGMPPPPSSDEPVTAHVELPLKEAKRIWVDALERQYLARLIDECAGNVSEAARRAEMDRGHLTDLLTKHGLDRGKR
jgi:DNA-binding NtrC family response regulator